MSVLSNRTAIALAMLAVIVTSHAARADEFDTSKIRGTVTDAAGGAVAGADVWINRWGGPSDPAQFAARQFKTTTDKNGKYELKLRHVKGEPFIVKELFAEATGYVRAWSEDEISLQGGNNAAVDFRLDKGEVIAGILRLSLMRWEQDIPAEALAGLSKETIAEMSKRTIFIDGPAVSGFPPNAKLHQTDKDGNFEFYVPRGEYTLRIYFDAEPIEWKGVKSGQRGLELKAPTFEWTPENVGKVFDELWDVMDRNYSYFFLKKDVNWKALRDKHRPAAVKANNAAELAAVLKEMLAPLNDLHVWIQTPTGIVSPFRGGGYVYNGNRDVMLSQLEDRVECGKFAVVGKTKQDGFGYFLMRRQSDATKADVQTAVEAIRKLRDVPAFVVDLRSANGGSEPLAQEIARLVLRERNRLREEQVPRWSGARSIRTSPRPTAPRDTRRLHEARGLPDRSRGREQRRGLRQDDEVLAARHDGWHAHSRRQRQSECHAAGAIGPDGLLLRVGRHVAKRQDVRRSRDSARHPSRSAGRRLRRGRPNARKGAGGSAQQGRRRAVGDMSAVSFGQQSRAVAPPRNAVYAR